MLSDGTLGMGELSFMLTKLRMKKIMSLEKLKQHALENPQVNAEYKSLEAEFELIDQEISLHTQAALIKEQQAGCAYTQKNQAN